MSVDPFRVALTSALVLTSACGMYSSRAAAVPVSTSSPVTAGAAAGTTVPPATTLATAESVESVSPDTIPADSSGLRLARHVGFRQAIGDAMRLRIVGDYAEERPGRLIVALDSGYSTVSTVEYHIKRIYSAYGDYLNHNVAPVIELRLGGRTVGDYTWEGLSISGSGRSGALPEPGARRTEPSLRP